MRILHTSDWHLGRLLEQINRIDEQKEFITCLCKTADDEKIDLVLVAGDIFDTYNPSAAAEELFYEAIDKLSGKGKRAVIVIAGNHDNPERLCAASPLAYKNGIILLGYPGSSPDKYKSSCETVKIIDCGPGWIELHIDNCSHNAVVITLPYPSESRLEEILSDDVDENKMQKAYSDKIGDILNKLAGKFRDDTVNLVVSHLFIRGGSTSDSERTIQVGGALTVDPEVLPEKAHFIALGHLHRAQKVKGAPCPAYYSGSPLAYSFSEAGYSKVVYIIDAEPGKDADIREVYLDCGKPLKKWVAEKGIEQAIKWCEEKRDINAWVDLEIYTDRAFSMEEQKKLRELHPGIISIKPVINAEQRELPDYENREGRKIDELFRDYYKSRTGVEISDELMQVFLETINEDEDEQNRYQIGISAGGEENEAKIS